MVKNSSAMQEIWVSSLGGIIPWRREWLPIPVFLPGEFHRQRSLVGYSPWCHKELDTTKWLTLLLNVNKVIWWGQRKKKGGGHSFQIKMLNMAHLLVENPEWYHCTFLCGAQTSKKAHIFCLPCCCWVIKLCPTLWWPHVLQPTKFLFPGFSRQEHWSALSFPSPGALASNY